MIFASSFYIMKGYTMFLYMEKVQICKKMKYIFYLLTTCMNMVCKTKQIQNMGKALKPRALRHVLANSERERILACVSNASHFMLMYKNPLIAFDDDIYIIKYIYIFCHVLNGKVVYCNIYGANIMPVLAEHFY